MNNRDRLCALRVRLESLVAELRAAEDELPWRNAAHEIGRAASMTAAAVYFVNRALGQRIDGVVMDSDR